MTKKYLRRLLGVKRIANQNNEMLFSSHEMAKNKIDDAGKYCPIVSRVYKLVQPFLKVV